MTPTLPHACWPETPQAKQERDCFLVGGVDISPVPTCKPDLAEVVSVAALGGGMEKAWEAVEEADCIVVGGTGISPPLPCKEERHVAGTAGSASGRTPHVATKRKGKVPTLASRARVDSVAPAAPLSPGGRRRFYARQLIQVVSAELLQLEAESFAECPQPEPGTGGGWSSSLQNRCVRDVLLKATRMCAQVARCPQPSSTEPHASLLDELARSNTEQLDEVCCRRLEAELNLVESRLGTLRALKDALSTDAALVTGRAGSAALLS